MNIASVFIKIISKLNLFSKNKKSSQPILIFISSYTDTPVLSMLANKLMQKEESILFVMRSHDEKLLNKIKLFMPAFNDQYLVIEQEAQKLINPINQDNFSFEKIIKKYEKYDFCFNTFKALYLIQQKELSLSKKIIHQYKPKLLIVSEDGISANSCLIKAAIHEKIPVLDVPYGYGSHYDLENALYQRQLNKEELYSAEEGIGEAIKKYYPQWVKTGRFAGSLLLNPYFILSLEELDISIKNPWTVHGGAASKIAVESKAMLKHYLREGIPQEKLILAGTPYCDYLKTAIDSDSAYQKAFSTSEKIHKNQTSILICWPPSYHSERGNLCEFSSYEELTMAVLGQLTKIKSTAITLSIHPAVQPQFLELIKKTEINISEDYILDELPKHDMYVSCYSSTIRWAIAAGKPVINYDFYKFNLNDYEDAPGVLRVENFNEFQSLAKRLIVDDQYYQQLALLQKKHASTWGMIDGLNFDRIYALINQLTLTTNK